MRGNLASVVLSCVVLAGCSGMPWQGKEGGEITLNWYCQKLDNGAQRCEKRRLQNGKPVDEVVYETLEIPDGKPLPMPEPAQPQSLQQAIPWDRDAQMVVNRVEDTNATLAVENTGPEPRKPRETLNLWEKLHGRKGAAGGAQKPATPAKPPAADAVPGQPVAPAAQPAPQSSRTPLQAPASAAPAKAQAPLAARAAGYTVQLAAFNTPDQCDAFMSNRKYRDLNLSKRKIINQGEPWWIVTHGEFASYGEAEAEAEKLNARHASIKPWARSWKIIRSLEKP